MTTKQKLLQGIEELESFPKALDNPFKRVHFINKEKVKELVNSMKFDEHPTVPKFVDVYLRKTINQSLVESLTNLSMPNIVRQWLTIDESNQELFALARSKFPPIVDESFDSTIKYRIKNVVDKNLYYLRKNLQKDSLYWGSTIGETKSSTDLFTEQDLVDFGVIKKSITELDDSTIVSMELVK